MSFLKRHQTSVAIVAALTLFAGAAYVCQGPNCGANCPLSGLFSATTAYAGPGCSASAKAACGPKAAAACDAASKASVQTASAQADGKNCTKHADGKTCSKDECIKSLMTEKGMTREQAEAFYAANCQGQHGSMTTTASATGTCPHSMTTAAVATGTAGKSCGDKETCIAKCMAEKGFTRAEAEACWAKCQTTKASGQQCSHMIQTAAMIETTPVPSREACVDALVAKGMTREAAETHVAKCEKEGMTAEAAVQKADGGHACPGAASTAKAGCCAKHTASSTTTSGSGSGGSQ